MNSTIPNEMGDHQSVHPLTIRIEATDHLTIYTPIIVTMDTNTQISITIPAPVIVLPVSIVQMDGHKVIPTTTLEDRHHLMDTTMINISSTAIMLKNSRNKKKIGYRKAISFCME